MEWAETSLASVIFDFFEDKSEWGRIGLFALEWVTGDWLTWEGGFAKGIEYGLGGPTSIRVDLEVLWYHMRGVYQK